MTIPILCIVVLVGTADITTALFAAVAYLSGSAVTFSAMKVR